MNIQQLHYVISTIENGSYTSASKAQFCTPQTISKSIGALEKELGTQLFFKDGGAMRPTSMGYLIGEKARNIVRALDDLKALAEMRSYPSSTATISLCAIASINLEGANTPPFPCATLLKALAKLSINPVFRSNSECLSGIENGVVDIAIAIGRTNTPTIQCQQLFEFSPYIAMSSSCRLASKEAVTVFDLESLPIARPYDYSFCHSAIAKSLSYKNVVPQFVDVEPTRSAYRRFAIEESGLFFVHEKTYLHLFDREITARPLHASDSFTIPICLLSRADRLQELAPSLIQIHSLLAKCA